MKGKMPDIEKLTDVQRNTLLDSTLPHGEGELALRIIDAQASALAEARQQTVEQVNAVHEELTAALAEARAECERFRAQAESWERGHDYAWDKLAASEAECKRLRAEYTDLVATYGENTERMILAESRLDAANVARTEADQRVLDAMSSIATTTLRQACSPRTGNPLAKLAAPCIAELARRGLKP